MSSPIWVGLVQSVEGPNRTKSQCLSSEAVSQDTGLRTELIEELADVLMYYNDVLLCYDISAVELKRSYISKFEKNMKRW